MSSKFRSFLPSVAFLGLMVVLPRPAYVQPPSATPAATINNVAEIIGDGAAHALPGAAARWIQIVGNTTNTMAIRIGDSTTSASRGIPIAPGGGLLIPPLPPAPTMQVQDQFYQLSSVYYFAAPGDKVNVLWGR